VSPDRAAAILQEFTERQVSIRLARHWVVDGISRHYPVLAEDPLSAMLVPDRTDSHCIAGKTPPVKFLFRIYHD